MSRPRIRSLKPEALQHRKVGRLSDAAFRLWIGLITQADDKGRVIWDAVQFRLLVFGYQDTTTEKVTAAVSEITAFGLARLYNVNGIEYVDLPSWSEHQKINKPSKSTLPAYEGGAIQGHSGNAPVVLPERSRITPDGSDRIGSDLEEAETLAAAAPPAPAASGPTLPLEQQQPPGLQLRGEQQPKQKGRKREALPADDVWLADLRVTYAGRVDVDRELIKLDAWLLTPKGKRRKKTRGFIVGWLNRHLDDQREVGPQIAAHGAGNVVPLKTPVQLAQMRAAHFS